MTISTCRFVPPTISPHLPRRRPSFPRSTSKEPGGWSGRTATPSAAPCWRSAPGRTGERRVPWEPPGRQKCRPRLWLLSGVVGDRDKTQKRTHIGGEREHVFLDRWVVPKGGLSRWYQAARFTVYRRHMAWLAYLMCDSKQSRLSTCPGRTCPRRLKLQQQ